MKKIYKIIYTFFLMVLFLLALGCAGAPKYSKIYPTEKVFHPRKIVALPSITEHLETTGVCLDELIVTSLQKKGVFDHVLESYTIKSYLQSDTDLYASVEDLLNKLSDSDTCPAELAQQITKKLDVEAILVTGVTDWSYGTPKEEKIAKTGLWFKLINPSTGKIYWDARHAIEKKYSFKKPPLCDMSKELIEELFNEMPL
ncbi:MAG: hypothetical protein ACMUJM_00185 [bacterium]